MIRRATTVEFRGVANWGRNEPLLTVVETDDGELLELYVKPSGRPELGFEGLANELFATCIAGHLGLPVCEPIIVDVDPDWIETLPDPALRQVMTNSSSVAFGSVSAGEGWRQWSTGDQILGARREPALGIFAFDAFTGNDDRRLEKPNLLVRGDEMRIIDHELCFRVRMKLFPRLAPWELGNLSPMIHAERHILGPALKADRLLEFDALRNGWAGLSNDCLEDYGAVIPGQWAAATGAVDDAIAHLKAVRDRVDECLVEVRRVLG